MPTEDQLVFWFKARVQLERSEFECIRVSGQALCKWCKRPYDRHPAPFDWCPTLVVDCEGRKLKT